MIKEVWQKIKKIKHIEIWIAVLLGVILCLIYFGSMSSKNDKSNNNSEDSITTTSAYVDMLENKLCNVISKIDGVGKVNVAITLESGFTFEYATDTETKTTVSGDIKTSIVTETVILVANEPVVVKEVYPTIKGVIVVADGAKDFAIKMKIMSAIETILEVDSNNITILY